MTSARMNSTTSTTSRTTSFLLGDSSVKVEVSTMLAKIMTAASPIAAPTGSRMNSSFRRTDWCLIRNSSRLDQEESISFVPAIGESSSLASFDECWAVTSDTIDSYPQGWIDEAYGT